MRAAIGMNVGCTNLVKKLLAITRSNPPLYPLPGGELDFVCPLGVPLLGVQRWVYALIFFKFLRLETELPEIHTASKLHVQAS